MVARHRDRGGAPSRTDVLPADAVDRDRRERGRRAPAPATGASSVAAESRLGAERAVERARLERLRGAGHRVDRDRLHAERAPLRRGGPAGAVVEHLQALRRAPAQPRHAPRAAAPAHERAEAVVGLRAGARRHRDDRVEQEQRRDDRRAATPPVPRRRPAAAMQRGGARNPPGRAADGGRSSVWTPGWHGAAHHRNCPTAPRARQPRVRRTTRARDGDPQLAALDRRVLARRRCTLAYSTRVASVSPRDVRLVRAGRVEQLRVARERQRDAVLDPPGRPPCARSARRGRPRGRGPRGAASSSSASSSATACEPSRSSW